MSILYVQEFNAIFAVVQKRFGPAEPGWKFQVEARDIPGRLFVETIPNRADKAVTVRLRQSANQYPQQRMYQLAHEAIHCLAPRPRRDTLWIEEGFANWHAVNYPRLPSSYRKEARESIKGFLAPTYHAFLKLKPTDAQIAALRKDQPVLDDVQADDIIKHFGATEELAKQLIQRLPKDRPPEM
jgi:hypothetical protein